MAGQQYNVVTNLVTNVSGFVRGIDQAANQISSLVQIVNRSAERMEDSFNGIGSEINNVTHNLNTMGNNGVNAANNANGAFGNFKSTLLGFAGAYLGFEAITSGVKALGRAMIMGNADMETYKNTLTTVMGSSEKAVEMLKWAESFAASTPFEIPDIMEATTILETYGISAKNTLGSIGDMASITGKPLMQAVEAIADAQTGELERLKEFGITKDMLIQKAADMGKKEIVNAKGQVTDMKGLNEALITLMNDRYKGGMEVASKSFKGMVSNVQDSVGTIMRELGKPVFEKFKSGLQTVVPLMSGITSFIKADWIQGSKTLTEAFGAEKALKIENFFIKIQLSLHNLKEWFLSLMPTIQNLGIVFHNLEPIFAAVGGVIAVAFQKISTAIPPIMNGVTGIAASFTSWSGFIPLIAGLVAAFATYHVTLKAITITQTAFNTIKSASLLLYNAHRAAMIAWAIAGGGVNGVLMAMRAAMAVLNVTLLANPIVLVVAALVGLGVAFTVAYKNSETFRDIVNGVWESMKTAWNTTVKFFTESVPKWINDMAKNFEDFKKRGADKFNSFKQTTMNIFNSVAGFFKEWGGKALSILTNPVGLIISMFAEKWGSVESKTKTIFSNIASFLSTKWNNIKSDVSSKVIDIYSTINTKFQNAKITVTGIFSDIHSTAISKWNSVKSAIVNPIESARDKVSEAINKIKGFFSGLKLSFPKISMPELPHFSLSGKFSLNPPSVPKLSVDWYKKGGLFSAASIIGVGEEPGVSEAVLPLKDSVLGKIGAMIAKTIDMGSLFQNFDQVTALANPNFLMNAYNGDISRKVDRNFNMTPSNNTTHNNNHVTFQNKFEFNIQRKDFDRRDAKEITNVVANQLGGILRDWGAI